MAAGWQQQVFALDARYNAHRAPNHPNFSMYCCIIFEIKVVSQNYIALIF
jgi:hypothetical protein